jgi:hypothetical protein
MLTSASDGASHELLNAKSAVVRVGLSNKRASLHDIRQSLEATTAATTTTIPMNVNNDTQSGDTQLETKSSMEQGVMITSVLANGRLRVAELRNVAALLYHLSVALMSSQTEPPSTWAANTASGWESVGAHGGGDRNPSGGYGWGGTSQRYSGAESLGLSTRHVEMDAEMGRDVNSGSGALVSESCVSILVRMAASEDPGVQLFAMRTLAKISELGPTACDTLIQGGIAPMLMLMLTLGRDDTIRSSAVRQRSRSGSARFPGGASKVSD